MKLKSIEIKNLRCFESFNISLTPKTTIIIGRNGAGKSTLLSAIKMAISFVFSNNKSLGNDFLSAGNPSLNILSFADSDYRYDSEKGTTAPDASINAVASYNQQRLEWELYKRSTSNASLYPTKYKNAFQSFMHEWKENQTDLPLIACFSDSFPHKATKQTQFAINNILKDRIPRNFGYYQWSLDTACTSIWETRLCNQLARILPLQAKIGNIVVSQRKLEEALTQEELLSNEEYQNLKEEFVRTNKLYKPLNDEIMYVQSRLYHFSRKLPKLIDEEYNIDYLSISQTEIGSELSIVFKNGKSSLLKDLPAGYHRLYSIVLDLACRAYILNPNGDKEPSGIVLIDEVDLHLHPSLEQEVIQCLREVFPNLQFIITTHSASVIANLDTTEQVKDEDTNEMKPANQLVFMQDGQTEAEILPVIYGLDYNAALRDFMDAKSQNREMKRKGDEYLTYCSLGLKEEAKSIIDKLIQDLGAEHGFVKELQEKAKAYEVH